MGLQERDPAVSLSGRLADHSSVVPCLPAPHEILHHLCLEMGEIIPRANRQGSVFWSADRHRLREGLSNRLSIYQIPRGGGQVLLPSISICQDVAADSPIWSLWNGSIPEARPGCVLSYGSGRPIGVPQHMICQCQFPLRRNATCASDSGYRRGEVPELHFKCPLPFLLYPLNIQPVVVVRGLNPYHRAKGKFHYPTAGLFSASLKMKIKIFFLLEIVRNDVKEHKMLLFPFRFHLT